MEKSVVCFCLLGVLVAVGSTESWRDWSPCNRPCGGGVTRRVRLCGEKTACEKKLQYKMCNTQDCKNDTLSMREEQCSNYNNIPFRGAFYSWVPLFRPSLPCALVCNGNDSANSITVTFQDVVADGTSCGDKSVCIEGKCLEIGCDDIPGSGTVLDNCGVCDGDGKSCKVRSKSRTHSKVRSRTSIGRSIYQWEVKWLPCSVTCGTGLQKVKAPCKNVKTGEIVSDKFCRPSLRPKEATITCTLKICPDDTETSHWLTGVWSPCPVSCGYGYKFRNVICKRQGRRACSQWDKPPTMAKCETGVSCKPLGGKIDGYQGDDWLRGEVGLKSANAFKKKINDGPPLTPRFVAGEWSACSVTCGTGVQTREVVCKVFFEVSEKVEIVSESQCYGKKPREKEVCSLSKCPETEVSPGVTGFNEIFRQDESFRWELGNYSSCSQSCLGGMQRTRLECVREKNGAIVPPSHCLHLVKPATKTRGCNNGPCPPRWKTQEYGPCTVDCGGGVQKRVVECVQDIGSGMTKTIPEYRCPDPIPISEQSCNSQFCPAQWQTGNWSDCSTTCGPGTQSRRAYCVKTPLRGHTVTVSDVECMGPRPMTSRECQLSECFAGVSTPPFIKSENYTFIQFKRSKRVKVTVGGRLVLLPGQSVTVTCPVKNYPRRLLFWSKGFKLIPMTGRVRTTFGGNLKIKKANPSLDAGTYTCMAGLESTKIIIEFQTKLAARQKAKEMRKYLGNKTKIQNLVLKPEPDQLSGARITNGGLVSDPQRNTSKKLVFTTGEWTPCSVTCGSGNQRREVMCARVTHKYVKILPDRECIKWGSGKPDSVRKCSLQADCPIWKSGKWSKCSSLNCVRDGFAQKKRPVDCVYTNGSIAPLDICTPEEQPQHKQECVNLDCMSMWQTSKWTECRPFCGLEGTRTRMLTCVWKISKLPAWSTCKRKPRPSVKKVCKPQSCKTNCHDVSRYCSVVGMLRMCRVRDFRQRCCHTCHKHLFKRTKL